MSGGATTKTEIRPIFSVGGRHKSENNDHYYREPTSDSSAHQVLLGVKLNKLQFDPVTVRHYHYFLLV